MFKINLRFKLSFGWLLLAMIADGSVCTVGQSSVEIIDLYKLGASIASRQPIHFGDFSSNGEVIYAYTRAKANGFIGGGGYNGPIRLFSVSEGKPLSSFTPCNGDTFRYPPINRRSTSPDFNSVRWAIPCQDGVVELWSPLGQKLLQIFHTRVKKAFCDAWVSPDGKRTVTTGSYHDLIPELWDNETGKVIATLPWSPSMIEPGATRRSPYFSIGSVAFSPDSQSAAISYGSEIYVWNTVNGKLKLRLPDLVPKEFVGSSYLLPALTFTPDGYFLLAGIGNVVRIWDAKSTRLVQTLEGHKYGIVSIYGSHDGQALATVSKDGVVKVWNRNNWKLLWSSPNLGDNFYPLPMFNPDTSEMLIKAAKGTFLYETKAWSLIASMKANDELFSPDLRYFIRPIKKNSSLEVWEQR